MFLGSLDAFLSGNFMSNDKFQKHSQITQNTKGNSGGELVPVYLIKVEKVYAQ
jgi:hypothetical protein